MDGAAHRVPDHVVDRVVEWPIPGLEEVGHTRASKLRRLVADLRAEQGRPGVVVGWLGVRFCFLPVGPLIPPLSTCPPSCPPPPIHRQRRAHYPPARPCSLPSVAVLPSPSVHSPIHSACHAQRHRPIGPCFRRPLAIFPSRPAPSQYMYLGARQRGRDGEVVRLNYSAFAAAKGYPSGGDGHAVEEDAILWVEVGLAGRLCTKGEWCTQKGRGCMLATRALMWS